MEVDESKFPYDYVPEHLKEKVKNCDKLSFSERFNLVCELSEAGWAKLGVAAIRTSRWTRQSGGCGGRRMASWSLGPLGDGVAAAGRLIGNSHNWQIT